MRGCYCTGFSVLDTTALHLVLREKAARIRVADGGAKYVQEGHFPLEVAVAMQVRSAADVYLGAEPEVAEPEGHGTGRGVGAVVGGHRSPVEAVLRVSHLQ